MESTEAGETTLSYRPTFRRQIGDPTTNLDSFACSLESGAMLLDYQTGGAVKVWGGQLVPYCGLTAAQISGQAPRSDGQVRTGVAIWNVAKAWEHWGETFADLTGGTWEGALQQLYAGNAILLQGDYDQFTLAERCQDSFLGNHAEAILPERSGTKWLTGDPLCSDFRWIEEGSLYKYAAKLGSNGRLYYGATTRHGSGLPATDTAPTHTGGDMPGPILTKPRQTEVRQVTGIRDGAYRRCFNARGQLWPVPTDVRDVFSIGVMEPFTVKGLVNGVAESVTFSGEMFEVSGDEPTYVYPRDVNRVS